jgi:hypothetical protein
MADIKKAGKRFAEAFAKAGKEAEAALAAEKAKKAEPKMEAILQSKQAPMTTPQGTGLPLMPRGQGMYTPGIEQKDLPRLPTVDKARAKGEKPKYTPRMQDLLDSPTARKKVDALIAKGDELGMREWYGTEPLRQVAMDMGMSQKQFDEFLAQMASASQRNPVDQQNKMGSYLWHLSQTGQLPEDAFLMTNKIKRGKQERPEGTAIELPPGYGSLAQGDIFSRGKQIASGDIEGALPPDKKLGTFYRNYQGNLRPVTVDVNAVRGPIIERGDPRWLASKLVEKDEEGNVIATHFPRKDVESGLMSIKQAKERPGFWEAAPSGSEYAGFEDLWQKAAKRKGMAPAEAQALGWYGSADVTALKTKPELYIDNLERMIRRTAEETGQSPRKVMEDVLRGKQYLKKDGGAVKMAEGGKVDGYQQRLDAMIAKEMGMAEGGATFKKLPMRNTAMAEGGGAFKPVPWKAAGGGWAKAAKAIQKAATEAGMKAPQTAEKELTTLQDAHTSLGDRVRERVAEANKMMEGFDYKYDKGQRVFTKDSAAKNKPPYTIIGRTRVGNRIVTEDGSIMGKKVIDPETGKAKRTPYEPGYKVRYENGDEWSEFDIPASAIVGDVEMAKGGIAKAMQAVQKASNDAEALMSAQKREESLNKFLSDSKVKERLYHATPKDFKEFKPGGNDPTMSGSAIWLTPDATKQPAAHNVGGYKGNFKEGTNVMPVHVQAKNPLVLDDPTMIEWARAVFADGSNSFPELMPQKWVDEVRKEGYDSIMLADPYGKGHTHEVIVFDPRKIKSAIGNRGTYNTKESDITKAQGGAVHMAEGGDPYSALIPPTETERSKASLMAEILARMAKEQGKEEVASLKKPRALTDLLNRGVIAPLVGAPVDLINMGLEGVDAMRDLASGKRVENRLASEKPVGGSEQLKDLMNRFNVTSGEDRPMMETGLSLASPAGAVKGASKVTQKTTGALNKIANTELNKSGKLTPPLTEAKTAQAGTPQGAKYATQQEGPFLRVRPTALDPSKAKGSGTREASGLSSQGADGAGSGEVRGGLPQRYSTQEVDRIIADPALNEPLQIAQRYTQENLGTDFKAPDIPESSLAKQSAIARTHELALTDDPAYKNAVFDAYARTMPDVLEQAGAKNYDDLMEKAYRQLAKETDAQFQVLPFNFSYHRGGEGNYSGTRELLEDLHGNKHMYVYQGGDPHDYLNRVDEFTGLNENEKFRAVHDAMGHGIYGNEFGPLGEEKAWAIHQQMYSPLARLAMTAETRGQNSLVNYSPLNVGLKEDVAKLRELQIEARRRGDKEGERVATEAIREAFGGFQFAPQKSILLPPEFVDPKYAGGMPDYIQPLVTPAKGTTTQSALTHFSHRPDLTMTDPSRYGTGIKGAEKERLDNTQNPLVPRTYFYAGEPGLIAPEPGLGVNRYRTESESLYDITADPLRFKSLARESNRTPFTAKYNAGIRAPDQELTDMERMIREYGYEGYINPKASKPAAVVYTPKQVERRRVGGLTLAKQ